MKTLFILLVTASVCLIGGTAYAGKIKKDKGGTYYCEVPGGDNVYYTPYGRIPTAAEQVTCAQKGGKIKKGIKKAVAINERIGPVVSASKVLKKNRYIAKRIKLRIAQHLQRIRLLKRKLKILAYSNRRVLSKLSPSQRRAAIRASR